jgi:hypothetical protein
MTTGTMQLGGFVATGAARPGVCPTTLLHATAQAGAPTYAKTRLGGTNAKPESWAFGIDRAIPRPWESFP